MSASFLRILSRKSGFLVLTSLLFAGFTVARGEMDITDRTITDPLLKIETSETLLQKHDKLMDKMRVDEAHKPPLYKSLLQKTDVFLVHPISKDRPAVVDFSAITTQGKGVLRLAARNHPNGDCILEISKGGQQIEKETLDSHRWETFQIPFDHEPVIVKSIATGWAWEYAFLTYSIGRTP